MYRDPSNTVHHDKMRFFVTWARTNQGRIGSMCAHASRGSRRPSRPGKWTWLGMGQMAGAQEGEGSISHEAQRWQHTQPPTTNELHRQEWQNLHQARCMVTQALQQDHHGRRGRRNHIRGCARQWWPRDNKTDPANIAGWQRDRSSKQADVCPSMEGLGLSPWTQQGSDLGQGTARRQRRDRGRARVGKWARSPSKTLGSRCMSGEDVVNEQLLGGWQTSHQESVNGKAVYSGNFHSAFRDGSTCKRWKLLATAKIVESCGS